MNIRHDLYIRRLKIRGEPMLNSLSSFHLMTARRRKYKQKLYKVLHKYTSLRIRHNRQKIAYYMN